MTTIHNHLLPLKSWTVKDSHTITKIKLKKEKPTLKIMRQNLGPILADAIFPNLNSKTQRLVGLGDKLKGPKNELWSDPRRQLNGEIILEPYPTRRLRQALTHQSILDLGEKGMKDWEDSVFTMMQSHINDQLEKLREEMMSTMMNKINEVRKQEREDYLTRLAMLELRLKSKYKVEVEALERKLNEIKEKEITEIINTIKEKNDCETKTLLKTNEDLLIKKYNFKINWVRTDIEEDYTVKLSRNMKLAEMEKLSILESKKKAEEEFIRQQIQSVVCTACLTSDYVISEFKHIVENLKKTCSDLFESNKILLEKIKDCEQIITQQVAEMRSWECITKNVFYEFQRFVKFYQKTESDPAYLLSWDKLVEWRNAFLKKLLSKKEDHVADVSQHEQEKMSALQVEESIINSDVCDIINISSIISSIIHRVIPSLPSLKELSNETVENILRDVESSSLIQESFLNKSNSSFPKKCPIYQRQMADKRNIVKKGVPGESSEEVNSFKEYTESKIADIIKFMNSQPNVINFIHRP